MTQFYNSAGASHHGTRFLLYRGILERKGGKGKKKSLQSRSKITPILKEDTNLGQKDCSLQWTPRNFSSKRFTGIYQPSPGQVRRIRTKEKQPAFPPQLSQPIFYNCRSSSECGQTSSIQRYSTVHCSLCSSVPPLAAGVGSHCTNGLCITWEGCCAPYTQHQQISRKSQVKMWNKPKIMPPSYERNSQTVKPKIASTGQVQREKQNATTLCGHLWFWNDNVNPGPSVQWDDPPLSHCCCCEVRSPKISVWANFSCLLQNFFSSLPTLHRTMLFLVFPFTPRALIPARRGVKTSNKTTAHAESLTDEILEPYTLPHKAGLSDRIARCQFTQFKPEALLKKKCTTTHPLTDTHANGRRQSKVINSFPSSFALQRMPGDNNLWTQMTDE